MAGGAAAVIGVLVLALLPAGRAATVVGSVLVLFGSLTFATAAIGATVRRELLRHVAFVNEVVERGVVEVLPPGRIADRLLERIYGESASNREVATALLGGEGRVSNGGDLTISEHTEIDFRLDSVDDRSYQLVMEQRYSFRNRIPTSTFVIFATSAPRLRDTIISGCRLPLFELWFVREDPDEPRFEDSVEGMRDSVRMGMQFADDQGRIHDVEARHPGRHLREVKLRDWGRYLDFFRADGPEDGAVLNRVDYMDSLRIFEIELPALAGDGAVIETILRLTIRSTTLQLVSDGFCYWQAPYPCFVESMHFDTTELHLPNSPEVFFHAKPFAISSAGSPSTWVSGASPSDLPLRSWMLPGHGVALMWRPFKEL
ncbi:hypothetical protein [Actinomycetospora sp. TBRC 11914]|uniref:hypothetical protein n=1 Tax=Actinomycetospora sp. TBRC 11914 TaxID=2729387 RepID=UPI00145CCB41|nr:hypothetical protein [Actinomycetospora sp. TBRC 11914]NMO92961.1 hypothetical protein [Actinomycetospora sp. TBRC 11914]